MAFTFECGVCHANYRLEDEQVTETGVKITCPKCLNFFLLKKGSHGVFETPVIEKLAPDGPSDLSQSVPALPQKPKAVPTKKPSPTSYFHQTAEENSAPGYHPDETEQLPIQSLHQTLPVRKEPALAPTPPLPALATRRPVSPPPKPKASPKSSVSRAKLTPADLSEYPKDDGKQKSKVDDYVMYISGIIILLAVIFFMNFLGVARIYGLGRFHPDSAKKTETPDAEQNSVPTDPKYGFPEVDPGYDPWANTPEKK